MNNLVMVAALSAALVGSGAAMSGSAEKGAETFRQKGCWQCHGFEGQGGAAGPRLSNTQLSEESLTAFVHQTNGAMPPYSSKLISESELADIFSYLQSRPQPPDPKTIPLLNP